MEKGLEDVIHDFTEEGQDLHRLIENPKLSRDHLNAEQFETLEAAEKMQADFIASLLPADITTIDTEFELPFMLDANEMFLAHLDVCVISDRWLAITDFKFGRIPVPSSEANGQLMCYLTTAAFWLKPKFKGYYAAIIQFRVLRKVQPVVYTHAVLEIAKAEIIAAYEACQRPDAPRRPSLDACSYCLGLQQGTCPEAQAFALAPARNVSLIRNPTETLLSLAPDKRTELFDAFSLAAKLHKTYLSAAKELAKEMPEVVPGYKLFPGGEKESIADMMLLYSRLEKLGATASEVLDICTMTKKNLEAITKRLTGLKGKALAEKMEMLLDGVVDKTPISPSFERL